MLERQAAAKRLPCAAKICQDTRKAGRRHRGCRAAAYKSSKGRNATGIPENQNKCEESRKRKCCSTPARISDSDGPMPAASLHQLCPKCLMHRVLLRKGSGPRLTSHTSTSQESQIRLVPSPATHSGVEGGRKSVLHNRDWSILGSSQCTLENLGTV